MSVVKYKVEMNQITTNEKVISNCNAITFINVGGVSALINNSVPLVPNANLVIAGNENEMDVTEYSINFGASATGVITVIRKINL